MYEEEGQVAPEHRYAAVSEMRDTEDTEDDREPQRDQRIDAANHQTVEELLNEVNKHDALRDGVARHMSRHCSETG
ncbi:hypothetical protein [Oricola indica]|uniref:hypothetical protein n=1 Tax=Oricola indica TaxID=2872591 RepID=UPI003CCC1239